MLTAVLGISSMRTMTHSAAAEKLRGLFGEPNETSMRFCSADCSCQVLNVVSSDLLMCFPITTLCQ